MTAAIRDHGGATTSTPPVELARRERFAALESALEALAEDERLAIHLHYLEDDPVEAAGNALGISRSGYYKLLARARNHLAEALRDHAPEDHR